LLIAVEGMKTHSSYNQKEIVEVHAGYIWKETIIIFWSVYLRNTFLGKGIYETNVSIGVR
jgi:hypothetical protein